MKKFLLIIGIYFLSGIYHQCISQEFSFNLFFEDSAGHKDTLTLGYDDQATDGIDTSMGEINIIGQGLNPDFDVRITDEWRSMSNSNGSGTFHTKKQIIQKKECNEIFSINDIDILTHNWPVTITWDSTIFAEPCNDGSLFTGVNPGGWWDTPGALVLLKEKSNLSFLPLGYPYTISYDYGYLNKFGDTIFVFWQTFGAKNTLFDKVNDLSLNRLLKVWPNPSSGVFNVELPDVGAGKLVVSNINGQVVYSIEVSDFDDRFQKVNIDYLPGGRYNVEFWPERLAKERVFYGEQVVKD